MNGNFRFSNAESAHNNDTISAYTIEAYPNPFSNQTHIIVKGDEGKAVLSVKNISGLELYRNQSYRINEEIELGSELPSGIYIVQVVSDREIQTIKIVKTE